MGANYNQGRQTYVGMRDIPTLLDDIRLLSYVDDCTILPRGLRNSYLEVVAHNCMRDPLLELFPGK